ncbi:hypothetical protein BDZ45DRAFT_805429 [Acephala macrosclerotiorum]|nr:hypothetical protein BDZ45DRAFT_805429 [Acephala macrosclerotiorum]
MAPIILGELGVMPTIKLLRTAAYKATEHLDMSVTSAATTSSTPTQALAPIASFLIPNKMPANTKTTVNATGFDSFTPFPRLPVELRLAIWRLAIEPRNLQVVKGPRGFFIVNKDASKSGRAFPSAFFVNVEGRNATKEMYELVLGPHDKLDMYVNWELDTFSAFSNDNSWGPTEFVNRRHIKVLMFDSPPEIREKIQHLLVEGRFACELANNISKLTSLKTLAFDHFMMCPWGKGPELDHDPLAAYFIQRKGYVDEQGSYMPMPSIMFVEQMVRFVKPLSGGRVVPYPR